MAKDLVEMKKDLKLQYYKIAIKHKIRVRVINNNVINKSKK